MELEYVLKATTYLTGKEIHDIVLDNDLEDLGWKFHETGNIPNEDVDYVIFRDGNIMAIYNKVEMSWDIQNNDSDIVAYHVITSEDKQKPEKNNVSVDLKEYNERFNNGEGIDDDELDILLEFHKNLKEQLSYLGPEFDLAKNEIRQRLQVLDSFYYRRNFHCI